MAENREVKADTENAEKDVKTKAGSREGLIKLTSLRWGGREHEEDDKGREGGRAGATRLAVNGEDAGAGSLQTTTQTSQPCQPHRVSGDGLSEVTPWQEGQARG